MTSGRGKAVPWPAFEPRRSARASTTSTTAVPCHPRAAFQKILFIWRLRDQKIVFLRLSFSFRNKEFSNFFLRFFFFKNPNLSPFLFRFCSVQVCFDNEQNFSQETKKPTSKLNQRWVQTSVACPNKMVVDTYNWKYITANFFDVKLSTLLSKPNIKN